MSLGGGDRGTKAAPTENAVVAIGSASAGSCAGKEKPVKMFHITFPTVWKLINILKVKGQGNLFWQRLESYLLSDFKAPFECITCHKIESLDMALCHKTLGEANKNVPDLRSQSVFWWIRYEAASHESGQGLSARDLWEDWLRGCSPGRAYVGGSHPGHGSPRLLAVLLCWSVSLTFCLYLWGHLESLASGWQMAFDSLVFWKSW